MGNKPANAGKPAYIPDTLGDRAADICESLLAIADLAGGEWPGMARAALVELCAGGDVADESIGIKLLAACREVLQTRKVVRISTKELLSANPTSAFF